ncbi:putative phosphoesterase protein [Halorhabdus tiamatea SARL4B]|uniref:Phosphoesterase n=1 Tax=Halorhabdus tiamatea SARL4B TaxID=1033806 RepID=F7PF19_9EURY|nr:metallophosphoesterase [Halorhabdus tiamatea]ERJ06007.1 putative phosphoesterase protein [Halorhabdus tiamatea SARL4B]CCQ34431.1 phosphodiesterase, MJ0936 family protein [Halorhabdus tiamatea SARL4B]
MKIGVIADTHDARDVIERAVERFTTEDVAAVVHCGDIVAPFSATPFDADFDFYAVRGNNDGEWALADTVAEFGTYLGEMGELTFDGVDFAVYHGTSDAIVDALVESGTYDYVLHGHTHERVREERDGTVRLNPGGVPIPQAPAPPAAVVIDTETGEIETFELD